MVVVFVLVSDEVSNDASDEQADEDADTAKEPNVVVGGVCGCFVVVVYAFGLLLAYGTYGAYGAGWTHGTLGAYKRRACGARGTGGAHGA